MTFRTQPKSMFRTLGIILILDSQLVLSQDGMSPRNDLSDRQDKAAGTSLCVQPAQLYSAADYEGPLKKIVVYFARKPEIKTVHPHPRPGLTLCALDASQKFRLFTQDTIEPVTFIGAAFDAGLAQGEDNDPSFGQGSAGYAKRYGAALADSVSTGFLHTYFFPVVFRQDPRYYRKLEGNAAGRFGHALAHVFVAESDAGRKTFNFSEWLGTTSSVVLSNTYHPGNSRGIGPACQRIGVSIAWDAGFDVLREFWPEVVHRLKLPFKERDHLLIRTDHPAPNTHHD